MVAIKNRLKELTNVPDLSNASTIEDITELTGNKVFLGNDNDLYTLTPVGGGVELLNLKDSQDIDLAAALSDPNVTVENKSGMYKILVNGNHIMSVNQDDYVDSTKCDNFVSGEADDIDDF